MRNTKRAVSWLGGIAIIATVVLIVTLISQRYWGGTYSFHGGTYEPERVAPELVMTDQFGNEFNLQDQEGKVVLVYFGYTFCPDFCPTTMAEIREVMAMLGPKSDDVVVAFVSVDPGRDTPERLEEYMGFFDPSFFGLSGSADHTKQVEQDWGIMAVIHEPEPGKEYYLVDHSTSLFAVDTSGNLAVTWPYGTDADLVTEDVEHLLAGS